jgi:putative endonuclease
MIVKRKDHRRGLGERGEALAAEALERRGYQICHCNWRCAAGEVDIVARHAGWWVFVEVRTRRGEQMGTPEASVTPAKQARLIQVAQSYLAECEIGEVDWRIDVVAVQLTSGGRLERLEIYENAVRG